MSTYNLRRTLHLAFQHVWWHVIKIIHATACLNNIFVYVILHILHSLAVIAAHLKRLLRVLDSVVQQGRCRRRAVHHAQLYRFRAADTLTHRDEFTSGDTRGCLAPVMCCKINNTCSHSINVNHEKCDIGSDIVESS